MGNSVKRWQSGIDLAFGVRKTWLPRAGFSGKALVFGLGTIAVVTVVLWLSGLFANNRTVVTALAVEGRVEPVAEGPAVVRPQEDYPINYPVGGRVARVLVGEGHEVRPDTVVVELDRGDLDLRRELARARLDAAVALAELEIPETTVIPEAERIERDLRLAEARIELKRIEWELNRRRIRAGTNARVGTIYARSGQMVAAGDPAFRLVSRQVLVRMEAEQDVASLVRPGQDATVRLEGYAAHTFAARVVAVAEEVDAATGLRAVFLALTGDHPRPPPGNRGTVRIDLGAGAGGLRTVVPRRALRDFRWVDVVENGRWVRREVSPGRIDARRAEILRGIEPGDEVILEGQSRLREGDRIDARRIDDWAAGESKGAATPAEESGGDWRAAVGKVREMTNGWLFSEWLGVFRPEGNDRFRHPNWGLVEAEVLPDGRLLFTLPAVGALAVDPSEFPEMTRRSDGARLRYEPGSQNPMLFFNLEAQRWEKFDPVAVE